MSSRRVSIISVLSSVSSTTRRCGDNDRIYFTSKTFNSNTWVNQSRPRILKEFAEDTIYLCDVVLLFSFNSKCSLLDRHVVFEKQNRSVQLLANYCSREHLIFHRQSEFCFCLVCSCGWPHSVPSTVPWGRWVSSRLSWIRNHINHP